MIFNRKFLGFLVSTLVCLVLGAYLKNWQTTKSVDTLKWELERNLHKEIANFDKEAAAILQAINSDREWPLNRNIFILRDTAHIFKWSSNRFFPEHFSGSSDKFEYLHQGRNHYLVKSIKSRDEKWLIGFLPLQLSYPIQNQFIKTEANQFVFNLEGGQVQLRDKQVFRMDGLPDLPIHLIAQSYTPHYFTWLAWLLLCGAVPFIFLMGRILINGILKRNVWVAIITLFAILYGVRLYMVKFNFPDTDGLGKLFDPLQFASSRFNNSIGNLFINTVFLVALAWLVNRWLSKISFRNIKNSWFVFLATTLFFICCFSAIILPFLYVETIFRNSALNLDISKQLEINAPRLLAILTLALAHVVGFLLFKASFKCALRAGKGRRATTWLALALGFVLVLGYQILAEKQYEIPVTCCVILVLGFLFWKKYKRVEVVRRLFPALPLVALVVFSVHAALAIKLLTEERNRKTMVRFANGFLLEKDVLGEFLITEAISKISLDAYFEHQMLNLFSGAISIERKIRQQYLSPYLNKYKVDVTVFDHGGRPLQGTGLLLNERLDSVSVEASPVNDKLFLVQGGNKGFIRKYLAVIPLSGHVDGFILLEFLLEKQHQLEVYPKLLLDNRFVHYSAFSDFSFAVFKEGFLINSNLDNKEGVELISLLEEPRLFSRGVVKGEFFYYGVKSGGQVAVVRSSDYNFSGIITNFVFYALIVFTLSILGYFFLEKRNPKFSFSDKIKWYVYTASIVSMIVISIFVLFLNARGERLRLERNSLNKVKQIGRQLALQADPSEGSVSGLVDFVNSLGLDATVYSVDGRYLASNQPEIFSNQFTSKLANPLALKEVANGRSLFYLNEEIGTLKFKSAYTVVKAPDSLAPVAILSMPFFDAEGDFELSQLDLLATLCLMVGLVFILSYIVVNLAVASISAPIDNLVNSLKSTSFNNVNQKLAWDSNDEIGRLVKGYNIMLENLLLSRETLVKQQREAAWRDLARQVAHEIKNPLTPIKLHLQKLELEFGKHEPNSKTLQSIKAVLEQVDIIRDIASSFSSFAQMPEVKLQLVSVQEVVKRSIPVFSNFEHVQFSMTLPEAPIQLMLDESLLNRILGNLYLNSIQAKADRPLSVEVKVLEESGKVTITILDNGSGMDAETVKKVFIPYFSTKQTGSGLGLVVAKQGIEQMGGSIECFSELDNGTSFVITFPKKPKTER